MNIWRELRDNGPLMILAPMEDVTDTVFRRVIASCGRPDLFFTEFTNCEGAQSVGQARVVHRLRYKPDEKPLIAQVWGITPEDYYKTARLIRDMGFDGVDINMGCPVKKVVKAGACSALIKNPSLAQEIVQATKEGAGEIPVSVKTRIGFNHIVTEEWVSFLIDSCKPAALTIHGRTVKEQSKVPNHWDEIGKSVAIRNSIQSSLPTEERTLIIGNGDIISYQEAQNKIIKYGLDGIMIGRGIFHNPWIFDGSVDINDKNQNDRIELLILHLKLWGQEWGESKNFQKLKKYYKMYIQNFPGAAQLRSQLMEIDDIATTISFLQALPKVC